MLQVRSLTAATRTNTEPATDSRRSDDDVSQVRSVAGTNSEPATDSRRSDDEMSQVRSVPFTRTNTEPATDSRSSDDDVSQVRSRSEEHTSELQSIMPTSYAVFCLTTKNHQP